MSLLRLLNVQGIAGLGLSIALGMLLLIQKGETRHWKSESSRFEQLHQDEQQALAETVANARAAADAARASDHANAERVAAEQRSINERTSNDYETRLAAARTLAQRLRRPPADAAADPGHGGSPTVPGLPASPAGVAQRAPDGFSDADRLTAAEQAIQLDELIKWVRAQHAVDVNRHGVESGPDSR